MSKPDKFVEYLQMLLRQQSDAADHGNFFSPSAKSGKHSERHQAKQEKADDIKQNPAERREENQEHPKEGVGGDENPQHKRLVCVKAAKGGVRPDEKRQEK